MTGTPPQSTRIPQLSQLLARTYSAMNRRRARSVRAAGHPKLSDGTVIKKALGAKNGDKFRRLYFDGDLSDYDGDDSRGDEALCFLLAFYSDHDQIDRIFRQSALYREKWDRKTGTTTYGELTIEKATLLVCETYQGAGEEAGDEQRAAKKPLSALKFDRNVQHSLCHINEDRAGNEHIQPVPGQIATHLQENYFDFITFRDTERIYFYDAESGLYVPGGESQIKGAAETLIGDPLSTHSLQQIIAHIQRQTYVDREEVDKIGDLDHVAVSNGILNTRTRVLAPFSPKLYYLSKLPMVFDPSAPTDVIDTYMMSTFDPRDIPWLQEYYGWHLERSMRFQKEAMLRGNGDNGKTVFENILMAVLGQENCSSVSIQDMSTDPYAVAELYQKVANIYDDLPAMRLRDTGQFKILFGNGRARARRIYEPPFYFWNYAKGTYSTNRLPGTRDMSLAFFKRWMIAEMPFTFVDPLDENGKPTKLGRNQKDKEQHVEARMTTPKMRSSWLNWFLDGLDRLRKNECFTSSKSQDEIREIWLRQTAPISIFAKECIEESIGASTEKKDVYRRYQEWCEENDISPEKEAEFAKTFKEHGQDLGSPSAIGRQTADLLERHTTQGI